MRDEGFEIVSYLKASQHRCIATGIRAATPYLAGVRGTGKSSIAEVIGKELGLKGKKDSNGRIRYTKNINLSRLQPYEFAGTATVDHKRNKLVFVNSELLTDIDPEEQLLFFDEIDKAYPDTLNAALRLFTEGELADGTRVPDNLMFLAAGNGTNPQLFTPEVRSRFWYVPWGFDEKEWKEFVDSKYPGLRDQLGFAIEQINHDTHSSSFNEASARRIYDEIELIVHGYRGPHHLGEKLYKRILQKHVPINETIGKVFQDAFDWELPDRELTDEDIAAMFDKLTEEQRIHIEHALSRMEM